MDWILDGSSEWDTDGRTARQRKVEREAPIEKLKRRSRMCEEKTRKKKPCGAGLGEDIAGLIKTLKLGNSDDEAMK